MKMDPVEQTLQPFDFSQILEEVPELGKFAYRIDSCTFESVIDSADIEPRSWQALASLIEEKYDSYDGFVVLHGTDTMAYSASALSFMIDGLTNPVIFTGSQLPIGVARTDGKENLISSVEIISGHSSQQTALSWLKQASASGTTALSYGSRMTGTANRFSTRSLTPGCQY